MYNKTGMLAVKNPANRNSQDPFGKHIYICIHPDDRAEYLDAVSNMFLQLHDSFFVWSHKEGFALEDDEASLELLEDIRQNRIFVACVTRNFLLDNDICMWEFRQALNLGMNILPLFLEEGCADGFNRISGDMMAFEPYKNDPTAIPFSEKFVKYVGSTVGIGKNPFENVEKAFDARIFISYRKKDRKYVAPLMEAIHANDMLKGVSIWFDESLEINKDSYDKQIEDVINKADLCILLLTEHTLEQGNYVANIEYPYMCEHKKPILTVVADSTMVAGASDYLLEAAKQNNRYAEPIENAVKLDDDHGIAEEVIRLLSAKGLLQDVSKTPEQLYNLGLAYKSHYLMEQSADNALYFFEKAINGGYIEAFEQVVAMYEYGIGMPRDEELAVRNQEVYTRYLMNHQDGSFENAETTYSEMSHMVEMYRNGDYDSDAIVCDIMVKYTADMMERFGKTLWKPRYYSSLRRYAQILYSYKRFEEALSIYKECYEYYIELGEQFYQKGIAVDDGMGFTKIEDIFTPLTECLMGMSLCNYRLDNNRTALSNINGSINIKVDLYNKYRNTWALKSLYKERQQLIRYLIELHIYDQALSQADADYKLLIELSNMGLAQLEHEYACIENFILTGDIAMFMGNGKEAGLYERAREELEKIMARDTYRDEKKERSLCKLLAKRGFEL